MNVEQFKTLMTPVTEAIAGRPVDAMLEDGLNREFPGDGAVFEKIEKACHQGIKAGWMLW